MERRCADLRPFWVLRGAFSFYVTALYLQEYKTAVLSWILHFYWSCAVMNKTGREKIENGLYPQDFFLLLMLLYVLSYSKTANKITFFKHVYISSVQYMSMPCLQVITWKATCELNDIWNGPVCFWLHPVLLNAANPVKKDEIKVHHQPTSTLLEDIAAYFYLMATLLGRFYHLKHLKDGEKAVVKIGLVS